MTLIDLLDKHWDGIGYFFVACFALLIVGMTIGAVAASIASMWGKHD